MSSLRQLDAASQSVLNEVSSDRRQLTVQTVTSLLSHLQTVADEATKQDTALCRQQQDLTMYQVCL